MPTVKKKDIIKRETIVKNFDRICNKIKVGKFTTNASRESIEVPRSLSLSQDMPSTSAEGGNKVTQADFIKERHRHAYGAMETLTKSSQHAKGFHDYSKAQKHHEYSKMQKHHDYSKAKKHHDHNKEQEHNYDAKHNVTEKARADNVRLNFPTWDATLRHGAGSSVDLLRDYRIPKKSSEIQATESAYHTNITAHAQSRSTTQSVSHVGNLQHGVGKSEAQAFSQSNHARHILGQSGLSVSTTRANSASHTQAATHHTSANQPVLSTVKQLASKPAHKSLVSPVIMDNTAKPPFSSFTEYSGSQQQLQAQTKTSPPQTSRYASQQQQPFMQFTQAATYHQGQPHRVSTHEGFRIHHAGDRDGQDQMSTISSQRFPNQHTYSGSTQEQPSGVRPSLLKSIDQHLPSNVHSVKTQSKLPSAIQASGKTTVVPLSYLGSFVPYPEKPCLSVPEVVAQLDSSQTQAAQLPQDLTHKNRLPHDVPPSTSTSQLVRQKQNQHANIQFQPATSLPQHTNANSSQSHKVQQSGENIYTKQQHTHKDSDSEIEMYSTHKNPVKISKSDKKFVSSQQEVVVVPQLKDMKLQKDIEVKQFNILSNLRKKMGLGVEPLIPPTEACRTQKKDRCPNREKSIAGGKRLENVCGNSTKMKDLGNLQSHIGQVIENVIRSDHMRQKEKSGSSLSSQNENGKRHSSTSVNQSSAQIDPPKTSADNKDSYKPDTTVTDASEKLSTNIETVNSRVNDACNGGKNRRKKDKLADKSNSSNSDTKQKSTKNPRSEEKFVEIETTLGIDKTGHEAKADETTLDKTGHDTKVDETTLGIDKTGHATKVDQTTLDKSVHDTKVDETTLGVDKTGHATKVDQTTLDKTGHEAKVDQTTLDKTGHEATKVDETTLGVDKTGHATKVDQTTLDKTAHDTKADETTLDKTAHDTKVDETTLGIDKTGHATKVDQTTLDKTGHDTKVDETTLGIDKTGHATKVDQTMLDKTGHEATKVDETTLGVDKTGHATKVDQTMLDKMAHDTKMDQTTLDKMAHDTKVDETTLGIDKTGHATKVDQTTLDKTGHEATKVDETMLGVDKTGHAAKVDQTTLDKTAHDTKVDQTTLGIDKTGHATKVDQTTLAMDQTAHDRKVDQTMLDMTGNDTKVDETTLGIDKTGHDTKVDETTLAMDKTGHDTTKVDETTLAIDKTCNRTKVDESTLRIDKTGHDTTKVDEPTLAMIRLGMMQKCMKLC